MSNSRDYNFATGLTEEQRLIAAHMHIIGGVSQHTISGSLGVNPGRVAEAISAIRIAMEFPMETIRAFERKEGGTRLSRREEMVRALVSNDPVDFTADTPPSDVEPPL